MADIEKEIQKIIERNKKVEAEKAWETSVYRKVAIVLLTYLVVSFLLWFLSFDRPFLSAIIPCIGYILSTFSLGFLQKMYIKNYKKS